MRVWNRPRSGRCSIGESSVVIVRSRPVQGERGDRHRALALADVGRAVLHRHLQLHRPLGEGGERLGSARPRSATRRRCARGRSGPRGRSTTPGARRVSSAPTRPARGLGAQDAPLVGLADVDPVHDLPGQVLLPQVGLVGVPQALASSSAPWSLSAGALQRVREDADHHALVGLPTVGAQSSRRAFAVDAAVDVGKLELGLVDRGLGVPCATVLGCRAADGGAAPRVTQARAAASPGARVLQAGSGLLCQRLRVGRPGVEVRPVMRSASSVNQCISGLVPKSPFMVQVTRVPSPSGVKRNSPLWTWCQSRGSRGRTRRACRARRR